MLQLMDTAPRGRPITLRATRLIIGLGPVDEPPFDTVAQYYPERGFWAVEDKPGNGLPSLGLIPLNPHGWIC
ncbi:MAG: hypothetical protein WAK63_17325 [Xanthobacteraceae bacterium]